LVEVKLVKTGTGTRAWHSTELVRPCTGAIKRWIIDDTSPWPDFPGGRSWTRLEGAPQCISL